MPIAILEALRSGVPIISTRVGGIPDVIEDGISGLLIKPEAPEMIAQAVLKLRRDEELRRSLAAAGEKVFEEKLEFSRGIGDIRTLYESF